MVAYSFNPRFIEPIRQGIKTQTIRAIGKRPHAQMGQTLQLYSGMRTAHCVRIIPDTMCVDACAIWIDFDDAMRVTRIETYGLPVLNLDAFARRDGFDSLEDMGEFWEFAHGPMQRFTGTLIEWEQPALALEVAA
jgi:hypothetical protein